MKHTRLHRLLDSVGGRKSVYERGLVSVLHPQLLLPKDPGDNMHILYSAEEIAARMSKVRIRHMNCIDRAEAILLQGEYKYFSGKKIHFQQVRLDVLVSILQSYSYFGFYSVSNLKKVMYIIKSTVADMTFKQIDLTLHYLSVMEKIDNELLSDVYDYLEIHIQKATLEVILNILVSLDRLNCDRPHLIMAIVSRCNGKCGVPEEAICAFLNVFTKMEPFKEQRQFLDFLEKEAIEVFRSLGVRDQGLMLRNFVLLGHFQITTHENLVMKWAESILNYFEVSPSTPLHAEAVDEYSQAFGFVLEALAKLEYCHPSLVVKAIDILEDASSELDGGGSARCLFFLSIVYTREKMEFLEPLIHKIFTHVCEIRDQMGVIFTSESIDVFMETLFRLPKEILSKHPQVPLLLKDQVVNVKSLNLRRLLKVLQVCEKHSWILPINEQEVLLKQLTFLTSYKANSNDQEKALKPELPSHDNQENRENVRARISSLINMLRDKRW